MWYVILGVVGLVGWVGCFVFYCKGVYVEGLLNDVLKELEID